MLGFLSRRRHSKQAIEALYNSLVQQARSEIFYAEGGVPDTPEGRFEMISLHVVLAIRALNRQGESGQAASQALFDHFFKDMDAGLREMGIGDTSIGKKIRVMAEGFYGRLKMYGQAADAAEDESSLEAVMARNLYDAGFAGPADRFAAYFRRTEQMLDQADLINGKALCGQSFAVF